MTQWRVSVADEGDGVYEMTIPVTAETKELAQLHAIQVAERTAPGDACSFKVFRTEKVS